MREQGTDRSPIDRGGLTTDGKFSDQQVKVVMMLEKSELLGRGQCIEFGPQDMTGYELPGLGLGRRILIASANTCARTMIAIIPSAR